MKHEPKNVIPMPGFISIRRVVKKSGLIELTLEQQQDIATFHIDAMGTGTEELTEARIDDEVTFIMDHKESSAYGHKTIDMEHHRILVKPENITAVLVKKGKKQIVN